MNVILRAIAVLMMTVCTVATSAARLVLEKAEPDPNRKVALAMGNAAYQAPGWALRNSVPDARAVAQILQGKGFEVSTLFDANRLQMEAGIDHFSTRADGAGQAVIFYSGHGFEAEGIPRLVAVDANFRSERAGRLGSVSLEDVMAALSGASTLRLLILDACLNRPFADAGPTVPTGLSTAAPMTLLT